MFGITALQLLTYLEVGALPETGEVLRELYGFEARRQELHQQALPAVVYLGCLSHTETFLQSYTQYRRLGSWPIVDADATARRYCDMGRSQMVYLFLQLVGNLCP